MSGAMQRAWETRRQRYGVSGHRDPKRQGRRAAEAATRRPVARVPDTRTVILRPGGHITVICGAGIVAFSGPEERRLLVTIVDALDAYEAYVKLQESPQAADAVDPHAGITTDCPRA